MAVCILGLGEASILLAEVTETEGWSDVGARGFTPKEQSKIKEYREFSEFSVALKAKH